MRDLRPNIRQLSEDILNCPHNRRNCSIEPVEHCDVNSYPFPHYIGKKINDGCLLVVSERPASYSQERAYCNRDLWDKKLTPEHFQEKIEACLRHKKDKLGKFVFKELFKGFSEQIVFTDAIKCVVPKEEVNKSRKKCLIWLEKQIETFRPICIVTIERQAKDSAAELSTKLEKISIPHPAWKFYNSRFIESIIKDSRPQILQLITD